MDAVGRVGTIRSPLPHLRDGSVEKGVAYSRGTGLFLLLTGAIVLTGWAFSIDALKSLTGSLTMKANAAAALLLAGVSLLFLDGSSRMARTLGVACAMVVSAIAGTTLAQHLFGFDAGIDQLLFREAPGAQATVSPGRMGPPASTCLLLGGLTLLCLYANRAVRLAQAFATVISAWALLAIVGYAYGATQLFGLARYTGIALHTAVALLAFGLGLLAARLDQGMTAPVVRQLEGAMVARRLLPTAVAVPLILGWLLLYGERAGYYNLGFGTALLVLAIIVIFTAVVWISAAALNKAVAERDAAQLQLHSEREELADFVENAPVGLHWVGADGTILWVNQAELDLLGYRREEYVGRNIVDFHADRDVIDDILARLSAGETLRNYEAQLRCKDGSVRQVQISSNVKWEEGRFAHTRCFTRDVTDRRRAQEAVLEAQRQLSMALSAARMGTWSWDVRSGGLHWSENLAEIHGLAPGTFGGTYEAFLDCVHPEDRERVDAGVRRAVEERSTYDVEFRVPFPDGTLHWVAGHGQVFVDAEGNPSRMIGIGRDITERRKAEEELSEAYKQAQEALKVRDTFLSVAGHEFRTPIGALSLTLHNLSRRVAANADEAATKDVQSLQRQVERLARLTEDLLEVGRIHAGKFVIEAAPVDLGLLVSEVVDRFCASALAAGSKLDLASSGPVVGSWDASKLDQAVSNVLANALKFGAARPVELEVRREGATAVVTVRDHGIGISPEDQARIFDRFERGASSRSYRGLGLGLWIASQIIEGHGGRIRVESAPGEGATFRVELPGAGGGS